MKIRSIFKSLLLSAGLLPALSQAEVFITIIQGLGGEPAYDEQFQQQGEDILEASRSVTDEANISFLTGEDARRENLLTHFSGLSGSMTEEDRAVVYLIGHGSYDDVEYKFNIPGPDINTADLQMILDGFPGRNHVLLNTSSTSGAILEDLAGEERIIITATRNGSERNATEFGNFLAQSLFSEEADLNKNNNISVQEAFDYTQRQVNDFFESAGRLATEHPQLQGEGAASFTLARVNQQTTVTGAADEDPRITQLQEQLRDIDGQIEDLQLRRNELPQGEYIQQLQALILESATINEQIDQLTEEGNADIQ